MNNIYLQTDNDIQDMGREITSDMNQGIHM